MKTIGIVGAGAWGTALAVVARRAGCDVMVWAREREVVADIETLRENPRFLPGITLDSAIAVTGDLTRAADADAVLLVVPAQFLRETCAALAPAWRAGVPAVICAKGIERETSALMSEIVAETLPGAPIAVLSGPSFAAEVALAHPTAVTLAARDAGVAADVTGALGAPTFRIYRSDDVIGAEIGGAVKNVLAIACGIVEGKGLGDNARAALITRGLAEITRLGLAKGARIETFMGLSGLGDLTLTCNAMQSRNFSLGVALGRDEALADILAARTSVAEGVSTASSVNALARGIGVDMPIAAAVDAVVNRGEPVDEVIRGLLARPFGEETFGTPGKLRGGLRGEESDSGA